MNTRLLDTPVARGVVDALTFRCIGPPRGGRVVAVAGDPTNPAVYYFGAVAGGIWKTEDAGTTWRNVSDGFLKTSAVGALAVSDSDPSVIYAGMGESTIRIDVSHGDGVYRSGDGGATWTHCGLTDTRYIGEIRIHPKDPDHVYVAALGHAFGPNEERGLFRTRDGGKTWDKVLYKSDKAGAVDVTFDPGTPDVVYATVWETHRNFHELSSGGPDSGIWKSTDAGDTWTDITRNKGLPQAIYNQLTAQFYTVTTDNRTPFYYVYGTQQDNSSIAVPSRTNDDAIVWADCYPAGTGESGYMAVHPDNADIVYVGAVGSSPGGGALQRYDHSSGQIQLVNVSPEEHGGIGPGELTYRFPWTFPILFSPHDPGILYTAGNVVFRSTDQGHSWQPISPDLTRNDR